MLMPTDADRISKQSRDVAGGRKERSKVEKEQGREHKHYMAWPWSGVWYSTIQIQRRGQERVREREGGEGNNEDTKPNTKPAVWGLLLLLGKEMRNSAAAHHGHWLATVVTRSPFPKLL